MTDKSTVRHSQTFRSQPKTPAKPAFKTPKPPDRKGAFAPIAISAPKVSVGIPSTEFPFDAVVQEPAPQPDVTLVLTTPEGLKLKALLRGKNFRKSLKTLVAGGPVRPDRFITLTGRLMPDMTLAEAGFNVPPPAAQAAQAETQAKQVKDQG